MTVNIIYTFFDVIGYFNHIIIFTPTSEEYTGTHKYKKKITFSKVDSRYLENFNSHSMF